MSFSVGGLVSGLDTNSIIQQLMLLEQQPILRIQAQVAALEAQQQTIRDLRTELLTLRNRAQDFQFGAVFDQFLAASSEETILTAEVSGTNPVIGAYSVEVLQLASATVASSSSVLGSPINPAAALDSSGISTEITAGTFTINGVEFTVDPATQSLNTILSQITASSAGVNASYDAGTDTVTFENKTAGDTSLINFGATDDTSDFLDALNVTGAMQTTGGSGSTTVTSTRNLGAVDPSETLNAVSFAGGAVTAGTFTINGISISVDPTADSLLDVVQRINDSDAHVTASYDSSSDTIRVVADTLGSRTISLASGTSNFLDVTNLTTATQTAGDDAQFTVNGGAVQTRNTNEVSDAIGGVNLSLLSVGTSTVTVSGDDDAIVTKVQDFITAYNDSVDKLYAVLNPDDSDLQADSGLRVIDDFLRGTIFDRVTGISGDYTSLADIGVSTGETFDASASAHLELDEDAFSEALRDDRTNVQALFSNTGDTGIADRMFDYLDDVTKTTGFLNYRAKANGGLDKQIDMLNDRIVRLELRVLERESRLRKQFARLEQMTASFQSQGTVLASLGSGLQSYF